MPESESEKNGLIKKVRIIYKFVTPQPEKQTTTVDKFPNISRSKRNQIMKFGH